jgi:hypothetical protein
MKQQALQQTRKTGLHGPACKSKPISWLQYYIKQAQPAWLKKKETRSL